ncbi:MAG: J domain-containing protein [Filifactoraceae bacterium]
MARDPYEVLELSRNASLEEVKKAYRRLAKMYHPDQYINNPLSELAKEKFIEVQEAYDKIMNGNSAGNGYSGGSSNQGSYSYQGKSFSLSEIRAMVDNGDMFNAKLALGTFAQKTAEWYFLSGLVDIKLGSYNSGLNYLQMAAQMEPLNQEYKNTFERIKQQVGGYQKSYVNYNRGGSSPLGCCCQMFICDSCCECCGCDMIPCI